MQEKSERRSNRVRTEDMKARLLDVARRLFIEKNYADTGTPEIVEAAGVTRGALYHHFEDKKALFKAVLEREAAAVAHEVEIGTVDSVSTLEALKEGSRQWINAMKKEGRSRLLLIDGPAALGRSMMDDIETANGNRTLQEGLEAAMHEGVMRNLPLVPLTLLLGAVFDRAAMSIHSGSAREAELVEVIVALLDGLAQRPD